MSAFLQELPAALAFWVVFQVCNGVKELVVRYGNSRKARRQEAHRRTT